MKIACFDTKRHDRDFLTEAARARPGDQWVFFENRLTAQMADQAKGFDAVCVFVHDEVDRAAIETMAHGGVRFVALRCAGFNNVDLAAAEEHKIRVARVPAYSPFSVAEHAVGMMMSLNRQFPRAYHRVRDGNFSLDGLLGFDMHGRTVGIVGTGRIGECLGRIMNGFGCPILAFDPNPLPALKALGARYVDLEELFRESDIISLHCPLMESTRHLVNDRTVGLMKRGVMLINTSRGGLVDTAAVIRGLKSGTIGQLGLDVYEEEEDLFFEDRSLEVLQDDTFARLLTFPNVLVTAHQAFFTRQALEQIASTTMNNLTQFERGEHLENEVKRSGRQ